MYRVKNRGQKLFSRMVLAFYFLLPLLPVAAQQLPVQDAPFYNGIYGDEVKKLLPSLEALAAERGNSAATMESFSYRFNAVIEKMMDHNLAFAARLGKRLRIAHGFYQSQPLPGYQIQSALFETDALLQLNKRKEALQPALPLFKDETQIAAAGEELLSHWQRVKSRLLGNLELNSAEFKAELADAEGAQEAFRSEMAPVLEVYGKLRRAFPDIHDQPEKALALSDKIHKQVSADLPYMSDIASIAAWAAYYAQDVEKAGYWLAKLDHEIPVFFATMPNPPPDVYSAWTVFTKDTFSAALQARKADYSERAYTLLNLYNNREGVVVANAAIGYSGMLRTVGKTGSAEIMRQHAQGLIDDNAEGAGNLLLRLAFETTFVERLNQAERLFSRALATKDAQDTEGEALVEDILKGWADVLTRSNKLVRAKELYQRLLKIDASKEDGPTRNSVQYYLDLSVVFSQIGDRVAEADAIEKANLLAKRILDPSDPLFNNLSANRILHSMKALPPENAEIDPSNAPNAATRSDFTKNKSVGMKRADGESVLQHSARLSAQLLKDMQARDAVSAKITLAELTKATSDQSVFVASLANMAAQISLMEKDYESALQHFRRASKAATAVGTATDPFATQSLFATHAWTAIQVAAQLPNEKRTSFADEAFEIVQHASSLSVGKALRRAQKRTSSKQNGADSLREIQDVELKLERARNRLLDGIAAEADIAELKEEVSGLENKLRNLQQSTQHSLASFDRPQPVTIKTAFGHLEPDEALIVISTVPTFHEDIKNPSLIFTLARDANGDTNLHTTNSPDRARLEDIAQRLRCQAALTDPKCGGGGDATRGVMSLDDGDKGNNIDQKFDFELAYEAYRSIVKPYLAVLKGRDRLIIVPDKPLLSMPFHLMITEPPDENTTLANAPWLIRSKSLTIMPSVSGFHAFRLRVAAQKRMERSFFGVGDPLIGKQRNGALPHDCSKYDKSPVLVAQNLDASQINTRSGTVSGRGLRDLQALPDTRCELEAGARAAGGESKILVQEKATETAVKKLSTAGELSKFDILSFATHGLIAGELGQSHAGLVFTPPQSPTAIDDGLLTSAEISELKLNADFVLLSACNTAAGDKADQEGLSGLASAFFHAGARSLLVSHWPVYSDAATRLTTGLFEQRRTNPNIDKAQAQRLAILAVLDDPKSTARERHPAYWAPFMLVGDNR